MEVSIFSLASWITIGYLIIKLLDYLVRIPKLGNLGQRYILVTGCDTGFGNAIAKRLDQLGCHVFAACLTEKGETDLKKSSSDRLCTFHMNVADSDSVRKGYELVSSALPEGTGLWGILNNAGIAGLIGPLEWLTLDNYHQVLGVNLFGLIDVSTTFLPLVKKARGRIVNTASVFGRFSIPGTAPYTVSKYGVEAFADSMRRQLKGFGIKVALIEPGFHKTNITDSDGLSRSLRASWNQTPQHVKEEYGEEFLEKSIEAVLKQFVSGIITEDIAGVVNAYEHALLGMFPRARYVIGTDAKLLWLPIQYMPEFIGDWVLDRLNPKRPLPAAFKKK